MGFKALDKVAFKSTDKEAVYKYAREHGCRIEVRERNKNTDKSEFWYYAVE